MDNKFLIIDGSSLFFRAFYALPLLKTKRGLYTNLWFCHDGGKCYRKDKTKSCGSLL